MNKYRDHDPYAGNQLIAPLGPIRSRSEVLGMLTEIPRRPKGVDSIAPHVLAHELMVLRDFHIPSQQEAQLYETIDLMIRQNYRYLDPGKASTWEVVSGDPLRRHPFRAPEFGAAVVGHSGMGKTQAIRRCLHIYPQQVVTHPTFPHMAGSHVQVVWLSVDIPASGRTADLASALMRAWDKATGMARFETALAREKRNGTKMIEEWQQVASAHFLGLLHLDEIQNLFKLSALKRRSKRANLDDVNELSIVEDQTLKWILTLMNTWQIPLLVSGTPDGISALMRRVSNAERFVGSGYHVFQAFAPTNVQIFRTTFLDELGKYQYVPKKLLVDDDLAKTILELTAGIPRLIIALWIGAHRIALERGKGDLRIADFKTAAATLLAPVQPAVAALLSGNPKLMARYEDLLPQDPAFWRQFGQ